MWDKSGMNTTKQQFPPTRPASKHRSPFSTAAFAVSAHICLLLSGTIASQAADTADRVRAIRIPNAGQVVKAQAGADGAIHLLGEGHGGPQYLKSTDGGVTFSTPIPVVDRAAQKPGLKFSVWDLAVGKDGRVHVAIGTNAWQLKLPKDEWGFYYTSISPGATAFWPVRNLNHTPSEGFSLAADARGTVTAAYLAGKIMAMVSHNNGETFTAGAELNPAWNPCRCCTTAVTYGRDGRLALLYREETNNDRDIYLALWEQGRGSKMSRARVSTTPWKIAACPMTYFAITPTAAGYLAAWPTKGDVYFARLDKDGAVVAPGEIKTPATSGMRTGVIALNGTDGTALVASKNKDVLEWQLYDAKGQPLGAAGSAASPGSGAAGVALPGGKFVLFL